MAEMTKFPSIKKQGKVTPAENIPIPKAELEGLTLLATLVKDIKRALLQINVDKVVAFTYNQVCLGWVRRMEISGNK